MSSNALTRASKFLSYILRHKPEDAGLTLDAEGWAPVDHVLEALKARKHPATRADLETIVAEDEKGRYAFSADGLRIRANQGHSVEVDLGLEARVPPEILHHGTVPDRLSSIRTQGLLKGQRQHVHLSADVPTAAAVGRRRGSPVVLPIDAKRMHEAGFQFHLSRNGVWLTDRVPPEFILWDALVHPN